jgi:hypothetical protein
LKITGVLFGLGAALGLAASAPASHAQVFANSKLYVGTLTCNVSGSIGLLFGSTKEMNCLLVRPNGTSEAYDGKIRRFGIDVGYTKAMHMVWHVYSVAESAPPGILTANYVGSQQSVSLGATAGGLSLVGSGNSIVLTSVIIEGGRTGVNVADGIAEMSLERSRN